MFGWIKKLFANPYNDSAFALLLEDLRNNRPSSIQEPVMADKEFVCASLDVHNKKLHSKLSLRIVEHNLRIMRKKYGDLSINEAKDLALKAKAESFSLPPWQMKEKHKKMQEHLDLMLFVKSLETKNQLSKQD